MHMLWPSPWVSKKPLCWELAGFKDVNNFIDYYHHSIRGWSIHKVIIFSTVLYFPLLNNINKIDSTTLNKSEPDMTHIVLHGDVSFKDEVNLVILNAINDSVSSKIDLMNHFIFSEFTGVFPFNHDYMAADLKFLKF